MSRIKISEQKHRELVEQIEKEEQELLKREKEDLNKKHVLEDFREGEYGGQQVTILQVRNKYNGYNFLVPVNHQISMRAKYYWINSIQDFLENGLSQEMLINYGDFRDIVIDGEEYKIHKSL